MSLMHAPSDLPELLQTMAASPSARLLAGGTDLLVRLRASGERPGEVIRLDGVAELHGIEVKGHEVRIGAAVTITEVAESADIAKHLPLLVRAAQHFASPPVRNMATIGGNICTASPAADTLPALYAMAASVELASSEGIRVLPLEDFVLGPGRTALAPGEVLAAVLVPDCGHWQVAHFEKVGRREALAISVVSLAALLDFENGTVSCARLAWGSVGPTVMRCKAAQEALIGRALTLTSLREAATLAQKAVSPISDLRASAGYRRQVAGNLLLRLAMLPMT